MSRWSYHPSLVFLTNPFFLSFHYAHTLVLDLLYWTWLFFTALWPPETSENKWTPKHLLPMWTSYNKTKCTYSSPSLNQPLPCLKSYPLPFEPSWWDSHPHCVWSVFSSMWPFHAEQMFLMKILWTNCCSTVILKLWYKWVLFSSSVLLICLKSRIPGCLERKTNGPHHPRAKVRLLPNKWVFKPHYYLPN